ncbi:AAA family ATPase [Nonomuraea jabiensis]|uniref:AAA family ATPase n=1 Tax=Nonomuraea jabiensis TaxID=882448 RepID=UPI0036CCB5CA
MLAQLIVLRGDSGSGKTSVARALREAYGKRGLAVVGQDVLRRDILRELDVPGGVNIGLIDTVTRYALDHGHHVILEGILMACRYAPMLQSLREDFAAGRQISTARSRKRYGGYYPKRSNAQKPAIARNPPEPRKITSSTNGLSARAYPLRRA